MKLLLLGATGMIGQGVLRECLLDDRVTEVVVLTRTPTGRAHPKLTERLHADYFHFEGLEDSLRGVDACLFCLGVSSAGLTEAAYAHTTHDLTLATARFLVALNPHMSFCYISGAGADSTEQGRVMWARVKGRIENALLRLPFKAVYLFRPGAIQPLHGIQSRTPIYRVMYTLMGPLLPLVRRLWPDAITTTERLGQAMIRAGLQGAPKPVLEMPDINRL
jgi:uncharacterized protein YbjT (DUF2867 family)